MTDTYTGPRKQTYPDQRALTRLALELNLERPSSDAGNLCLAPRSHEITYAPPGSVIERALKLEEVLSPLQILALNCIHCPDYLSPAQTDPGGTESLGIGAVRKNKYIGNVIPAEIIYPEPLSNYPEIKRKGDKKGILFELIRLFRSTVIFEGERNRLDPDSDTYTQHWLNLLRQTHPELPDVIHFLAEHAQSDAINTILANEKRVLPHVECFNHNEPEYIDILKRGLDRIGAGSNILVMGRSSGGKSTTCELILNLINRLGELGRLGFLPLDVVKTLYVNADRPLTQLLSAFEVGQIPENQIPPKMLCELPPLFTFANPPGSLARKIGNFKDFRGNDGTSLMFSSTLLQLEKASHIIVPIPGGENSWTELTKGLDSTWGLLETMSKGKFTYSGYKNNIVTNLSRIFQIFPFYISEAIAVSIIYNVPLTFLYVPPDFNNVPCMNIDELTRRTDTRQIIDGMINIGLVHTQKGDEDRFKDKRGVNRYQVRRGFSLQRLVEINRFIDHLSIEMPDLAASLSSLMNCIHLLGRANGTILCH